ncbi:MAG TPA: hypothetical protein VIV11_16970 [Kofleriaceae bacterium]
MRKAVVWAMLAGFTSLVAIAVAAWFMRPDPLPPLSKADRAGLVETTVGGERWLAHPTLGFKFKHPGGTFAESSEMLASMCAAQPDKALHFYAFRNADQSAAIMITMATEAVRSREHMARQLVELKRAMPGFNVVTESVLWDASFREARFHATTEGDLHHHMRLVAMTPKGHAPVLLGIMTTTFEPDELAAVLASFTPP